MKIVDKIKEEVENNRAFFSFEYFPPKTEKGRLKLYTTIEEMTKLNPVFIDVTWGAGGSTSDSTLEICNYTQNALNIETQMHLTCTNMNEELIKRSLETSYDNGVRNILALRGDPPDGANDWNATDTNFQYSEDLVKYIRTTHGDKMNICVAGYPEGHPGGNYKDDLQYLKRKVDAGADLIITQLFYDVSAFFKFYQDCREIGIRCPILPGIMPIISYNSFQKMVTFCKVNVPKHVLSHLESIKDDAQAIIDYGIDLCVQMCTELIDYGIPGLHFYTMNKPDTTLNVLKKLNFIV